MLHDRARLCVLNIERAVAETGIPERLGNFILKLELRLKICRSSHFRRCGSTSVQPRTYVVIGQLCLVINKRPIQVPGFYVPIAAGDEFDHDAEFVVLFQQRGDIFGKLLRQHVKVMHAGIDGRCLRSCVLINGRALADKNIHIGNADQYFGVSVGQSFGKLNLVEVLRSVIINR